MKILICDDEKIFLDEFASEISSYFEVKGESITVKACNTGSEALNECFKENIDAVFLDIDMPETNGFQVAKTLRSIYPKCIIIFCSSHNELVYDSFEYEPFWFLCKSNYRSKLEVVLDKVFEKIKRVNKEFIVKARGKLIRIKYQEVLYVMVEKHKIQIHTEEKVLEYRGNLSDIEESLLKMDFVKINSGCIVNLEWIFKIQDNELILKNDELLVISRSNKKNVKDAFFRYLEGK